MATALSERPQWKGRRLVLHAGTPKTGTTSLQYFLHENRAALGREGIEYPECNPPAGEEPKHQWIVQAMLADRPQDFADRLLDCMDKSGPDISTLILSTEGLYNHWWAFGAEAKSWLRDLAGFFDLSFVVWFREPLAFGRSVYIQCLRNPRISNSGHYGQDLSAPEMLSYPQFSRLFEYQATLADMQAVMGSDNVFAFSFCPDLIAVFCGLLDIRSVEATAPRRNATNMTVPGVAMLRLLNREDLDLQTKRQAREKLIAIDDLLREVSAPFELDAAAIERISSLCPSADTFIADADAQARILWARRFGRPDQASP